MKGKGKGKAKAGGGEGEGSSSSSGGGKLFWNEEDGGEVRQLQKVGFLRVGDGGEGERWWLSSAGDGNQGGTPSTVAEDDAVEAREKMGERKRARVRYEGWEEEGKRVGFAKGTKMKLERVGDVGKEGEDGQQQQEIEIKGGETSGGVDMGDDFLGWNLVGIGEFLRLVPPCSAAASRFG